MSTDEQLLAAYRTSHSDQAFAEIVRRHAGLVLRSAMRTLDNLHEAEDVMQAVFLVLAQRPEAVGRSLSGWLHEVTRRTACKVLRSRLQRTHYEAAAARQAPLCVAVEVASVKFSPDGKLLATGSFDRTIKLWDTASGQELATLTGHGDRVWRVAFSPDGKTLASASADRTVKLWGAVPKR